MIPAVLIQVNHLKSDPRIKIYAAALPLSSWPYRRAMGEYAASKTLPLIRKPIATMTAIVLDGKALAQKTEAELTERVALLKEKSGQTPILATVIVGHDPASETYVKMKGNACKRIGMDSLKVELPDATTTQQLLDKLAELNANLNVHGILLQHPVPAQIDERACFDAIAIEKDVDGVTSLGFGRMSMGEEAFGCCTPQGIMRLLQAYNIPLSGKHAVVIGRSPILGKPMAMMLLNADATVTICHSRTQNLADIVKQADILVAAVGKPEFVKSDWIKDGAVVVDAGWHPTARVGDIEKAAFSDRLSAYTPVPGGVGPLTINTLIYQTLESGEKKILNA
jgi:methylenetetrahydrofolate dehydrogenase (NADP+)/methenyltetrahydrofolate cyclohydrolase